MMMTYETMPPTQFANSSHRNAPVIPLVKKNQYATSVGTTNNSAANATQQQYYHQQPAQQQQQNLPLFNEELSLCRAMCGWIAMDAEQLTIANAQHYLKLIRDIMTLINPHSLRDNLLLSAVFYADRFVKRRGVKLEEPRKAFLVLLISALVTIKMWEDFEVKTETLERFTGISKKQISVLERQFLGVLEYSLIFSYEEMVSFQMECCFPQAPHA